MIDKEKMKNNCKKVKNWFVNFYKNTKNFLGENHIFKWIGFVILVISAVGLILELISSILILTDVNKFSEIIKYFYNFNIFDYITFQDFYLIFGGGLVMDIVGWIALILLGLGIYRNKNYFIKKCNNGNIKAWVMLTVLFVLGLFMFLFGFYRSMPKIMIPLKKINQVEEQREFQHHQKEMREKRMKEWRENGWKKKRVEFPGGFQEEGILKNDNLEREYYKYFYSNF